MRLIDADRLKNEILKQIDQEKTVVTFVVEKKIASWRYTDAYPQWVYCGNCCKRFVPDREMIERFNIPTNYCPNCGAKMGKEDEK